MADYTAAGTGALSGASAGATIGSLVPGIGTAIGAGVGGLLGGTIGLFGGKKKKKKISSFDKRQKDLNKKQHQAILGEGPLADLYNYDPEAANAVFDSNVSRPAYRNFKEKLAPQVTGQFRKNGLMDSSYAGDALSRVARDIQEGLDAQRAQFLYGEQNNARNAKRNAVENLQNRSTFAIDTAAQRKGFDIDKVLSSVTPEMVDQGTNYFRRPTAAGAI